MAGLLAVAIILLAIARRRQSSSLRFPLSASGGALLGFVWAAAFAQHYLSQELPKDWEGRDITLVGTIDSLPFRFDQGVRFNFSVEHAGSPEGRVPPVPRRIALSWYAPLHAEDTRTVGEVHPGERWQFTVHLRRPHGNANPYGFDYEAWLLEQDLRATGSVQAGEKNRRLDAFVPSFGNAVERAREWLRDRINAALPDSPYAGVIVALVIGDQREVSQSDWTVFNRVGVGHLFSISGLHITMIAGLAAALVSALWRRSFFTDAHLPLLLPAQKAAALAGAMTALIYVLLAGFGVPAQRTLYMISVVAIALWTGRIVNVSHVLCSALLVVVLLDPWAGLWPGFWLSFGAVAIILYASVGRGEVRAAKEATAMQRWLHMLKPAAHTQYVVTLGLVPLTMLLFGQISLVSPIANALAIPVVSLVITPLSLVGAVLPAPLSGWILHLAHQLLEWLALFLNWLSDLSLAVWAAPIPPWWAFLCAFAGVLWMLAPRGWPVRWMGIAACLPLALNAADHPREGEMWVTAFDIGQGMALLIETPHHRLLYDTGPAYSPESDGGSRVIVPYLKARGITALDGVIVSHSDTDHSGGALSVFDAVKVGWLSSSLPIDHPVVQAIADHRRCQAGQNWDWDGARFDILHPTPASYDSTKWKPNARSCTLKITLGKQSMLLPGDIEAVQEDELVNGDPEKLRSTVLLAPHHGSGTSSTLPFLHAVDPQVAIFQVGYRNRYHHPKQEVFERYGELGIKRLRSDAAGAVTLHFGAGVSTEEYRMAHARYWYGK